MSSLPLLVGAASCVLAALATQRALAHRVGERLRPATKAASKEQRRDGAVAPADGECSLVSHRRGVGLLERWYMAQIDKRGFVVSVKVRGRQPSCHQLHCALSTVALAHPTMVALPSPRGDEVASQITDAHRLEHDRSSVAFPLAALASCCEVRSAADHDALLLQLINLPMEPMSMTQEEYDARHSVAPKWSGLRIILLTDDSTAAGEETEYTIVVRIAHVLGDGLSGLILLKNLLTELAHLTRPNASPPMTSVPISALQSIATYPSLDDGCEYRPTVKHVLHWMIGEMKKKFTSDVAKEAAAPWIGKSLVSDPEDSSEDRVTQPRTPGANLNEYITIRYDAATTSKLLAAARANKVTLHAVLAIASAFAAGVVSGLPSAKFDVPAPFSTRPYMTLDRALFGERANADQLFGNYIGFSPFDVTLSTTSKKNQAQDFWHLCQSYVARLRADVDDKLQGSGMIGFVDIRQWLREQRTKLWRLRNGSVLTSNLGAVDAASNGVFSSEWQRATGLDLLDVQFVQPAWFTQSVFVNNVVACTKAGLTNHVVFPLGVVTHQQARRYEQTFHAVLERIVEGATCTYEEIHAAASLKAVPATRSLS